jgi:hypothetical protein
LGFFAKGGEKKIIIMQFTQQYASTYAHMLA